MHRLRVATLNIWNRSGPWEARLALIRARLEALGPDLLGLQEVLEFEGGGARSNLAEEIAEGLGYDSAYGMGHELRFDSGPALGAQAGGEAEAKERSAPGRLTFGNALLSRHPILRKKVHPLPGADPGALARSLLEVWVRAPFGVLPIFVTHLNWKLHEGAIRVAQVRAIAAIIAEAAPIEDEIFPPILMGDLNAEPESDEIRFLSGLATIDGQSVYFADVWRAQGQGAGATFSPQNAYAAPIHEPARRIDYIFVRGPDRRGRGKPLSASLCFDTPEGGIWPSDHFGVVSDLWLGEGT